MATHKMHMPEGMRRHAGEITGVVAILLIGLIFGIVYVLAVNYPRDHPVLSLAAPVTAVATTS